MKNMPITLHELLASRDARHATQQKLLAEHSGKTLVCLTVVMPGSVKRNLQSLTVAHAAVEAMRKAFGVKSEEQRVKNTDELMRSDELIPETELLTNELKTNDEGCLIERDNPDAASYATMKPDTACECGGTHKKRYGQG